jgi:SAM-dependent methyltransferase
MSHATTNPTDTAVSRGPGGNPGTIGAADIRRLAGLTCGLKQRIRSLLELSPGQRVLDAGCGPGLDAVVVANSVGPAGRVVGIDYDASMIREAIAAGDRATPARVWYQVADAAAIPYGPGTFDRCYSERVLQHTCDAAAVVAELARVTKPGGVIVIADTDWATLSIDTSEPAVERALVRFVGDTIRNGFAGRQLRRLMTSAALTDVAIELWPIVWTDYETFHATSLLLLDMGRRAVRAGVVSNEALNAFEVSLADADGRGEFFASATVVVARGRNSARGPAAHRHD